MRISGATIIGLLLGVVPPGLLSAAETSVELRFPAAEMLEADERAMAQYLRRPSYFGCDFVFFDVDRLVDLIKDLADGVVSIGDSSILVFFPDGKSRRYLGVSFEKSQQHRENGPFRWDGKPIGDGEHFASIVVDKKNGSSAFILTGDGIFRLSPSSQPNRYFLCRVDPAYPERKIG